LTRSAEPPPPPEVCFDRSLGHETAAIMRAAAWTVHLITEAYPDAELVSDEVWIAHAAARGWVLLSRDARIRYRGPALAARHRSQIYYLGAHTTLAAGAIRDVAAGFLAAGPVICRNARRAGAGCWIVHPAGVVRRRWP